MKSMLLLRKILLNNSLTNNLFSPINSVLIRLISILGETLTTFRARGEIIAQTEGVNLRAQFYDLHGNVADLASFPQITIIQPSGNVALGPTSAGVYRLGTGLYGFDYVTGINANLGVWADYWRGTTVDGYVQTKELNFMVQNTQMPMVNLDGYEALGDDVGFQYSQTAIRNINKLVKALKARLNSSGKAKSTDQFGNVIYVDCDIYSVETLVTFIGIALTDFNQIPHFTNFTFEDTEIINNFFEVILQGAVIYALASKALIERGREFQISDNGIQFTPPTVSELLNTQWSTEIANHFEKLKLIKASQKPQSLGLGTLTISSSRNPSIARLRHLRARQLL